MRQLSIADMTFSCAEAQVPGVWPIRQAGPWRRKISATSIVGRDTAEPRQARRSYLR